MLCSEPRPKDRQLSRRGGRCSRRLRARVGGRSSRQTRLAPPQNHAWQTPELLGIPTADYSSSGTLQRTGVPCRHGVHSLCLPGQATQTENQAIVFMTARPLSTENPPPLTSVHAKGQTHVDRPASAGKSRMARDIFSAARVGFRHSGPLRQPTTGHSSLASTGIDTFGASGSRGRPKTSARFVLVQIA